MKKLLALVLSVFMAAGLTTRVNALSGVEPHEITYNLTLKNMHCNYGVAYAIAKRIIEVRKENEYKVNESVNLRWTKAAVNAAMQRAAEYCMTFDHLSPNHMDGEVYSKNKYHFGFGDEVLNSSSGSTNEEIARNVVNTWLSDDAHAKVIYSDDATEEFGVGYVNGSACFIEGETMKGGDTSEAPKTGGEYRDFEMPFGTMGKTLSPHHLDDDGGVITDRGYLDVVSGSDPNNGDWPEVKTQTVEPGKNLQMHIYALNMQQHIEAELNCDDDSRPTKNHQWIGNELKQEDFKWESSNPKVATVDEHGNITGVSKGTAQISYGLTNDSIVSIADEHGSNGEWKTGEECQQEPTAENIPDGLEDRMKNTITVKVESPDDPLPQEVRKLSDCILYRPTATSHYTYLKYGSGLLDDVLKHSANNDTDDYNDYDVEGVQADGQLVYGGSDPYTYTGPVAYYKITGRKKDKCPYYTGTIYVKCKAFASTLKSEEMTANAQFSTEEEYSAAEKKADRKTEKKDDAQSQKTDDNSNTEKKDESNTPTEDIEAELAKRSSVVNPPKDITDNQKNEQNDTDDDISGTETQSSRSRDVKPVISASKTAKSGKTVKISLKNAKNVTWTASKGIKFTKKSDKGAGVTAKAGTYTVTALVNGKKYSVRVKFRDYLEAPKKMTIRKGKSYKLKVKSSRKVAYKTSSKKIKVKKGKVKASRKGKYTITVKAGKLKKKIRVTVK